jgi:hypothetical protein
VWKEGWVGSYCQLLSLMSASTHGCILPL